MEPITPFGFASRTILLMTGMVLLLSASASAQGASALTGAVLDEAGLVLPGVTTQQILASVIRTARQRLVDLTELFTTLLRSPRPTVPKALQAPPR